jgi:hypothetical protein
MDRPAADLVRRIIRSPLLVPVFAYAASRVVVLFAMGLAAAHDHNLTLVGAFTRWDGQWYVVTAQHGYPTTIPELPDGEASPSGLAFFPLFPLLIRAVVVVTQLPYPFVAIVLAHLFGLAVAVLVWMLVQRISGRDAADRAAILFCFFPGAYVLSMAYAESVMLVAATACLIALLDRRWVVAGLAAAFATAARPNGLALCFCCAWAALAAIRRDRDWRALLAPALSPIGILAFFAYLAVRTKPDRLAWFRVEREAWEDSFDAGWTMFGNAIEIVTQGGEKLRDLNYSMPAAGLLVVAAAGYLMWRWRPPAVVVIYTVIVIVLAIGSQQLGARPRFIFTAFPLVAAMAIAVRGHAFTLVAAGSAGLLAGLAILSTTNIVSPAVVP